MNDLTICQEWSLIGIVREPVDRFISGFVDKCVKWDIQDSVYLFNRSSERRSGNVIHGVASVVKTIWSASRAKPTTVSLGSKEFRVIILRNNVSADRPLTGRESRDMSLMMLISFPKHGESLAMCRVGLAHFSGVVNSSTI